MSGAGVRDIDWLESRWYAVADDAAHDAMCVMVLEACDAACESVNFPIPVGDHWS